MLKKIGRLDAEAISELDGMMRDIFKMFDENKLKQVEKQLINFSKTPNYFVREYIGKHLIQYKDHSLIDPIAERMLENKIYGVRATGLFYFYEKFGTNTEEIMLLLERCFESIPWEVESLINEMWKRDPQHMKKTMMRWIKSDNERKRALAFHGMEAVSYDDPGYIMDFVSYAIDDDSVDVQKKITHILTQVARVNPIIVFPYIREWLIEGQDRRTKTIWVSMKKLTNIVVQKHRRDRNNDFVVLTQQTVQDWMNDDNEYVSNMGERLGKILNMTEDDKPNGRRHQGNYR